MIPTQHLFREIQFGSEDYEQECRLRNELLRKPLGLSLWDEDLSVESEQLHFGAFGDEGTLQACGVVHILSETKVQIRQVAVQTKLQGCGMGTQLMKVIEDDLRGRGFTQVILHARCTVCDFYQKLNYEVDGDFFEEIGLAHFRMGKSLLPERE